MTDPSVLPPAEQARRLVLTGRAAAALELLDAAPASVETAAQRVAALMVLDRLEEAAEAMTAADADFGADSEILVRQRSKLKRQSIRPDFERAREARALAVVAAMPHEAHQAIFTYGPADEMVVCTRPGADTVIVSLGLWLPRPAEDLLFASMGWSAVHLPAAQSKFRRDPLWVLENRARIAQDVLDRCAQTGATRVIFTGCSGQGMGAIGIGTRAMTDAVLAFSPMSTLAPHVLEALADMRRSNDMLAPVIASTDRIVEVDALADLKRVPTETTVVFDPVHPFDSEHAYRLAQAEHVRLETMPGEGHLTSLVSIIEGSFQTMARETLERAEARGAAGWHGLAERKRARSRSARDERAALTQAARWIPVGRGEKALALLAELPPSAEVAEQTILALTQLDRLDEAAEALAAAERDWGADQRGIVSARAKFNRTRGRPQNDRTRLLRALDYIAALPGEPHPDVFNKTDYIACPRPGAKPVVVSLGLWLPLAAEDLLYASMGWSAVHVPGLQMKFRRDPLWVIENRQAIGQAILEKCRQVEASWILFTGSSGQGMGAIGLATTIEADGILAFAPTSSLDPHVLAALQDMRSEGSILAPVLASTERIKEVDVLKDLQATPTETTVVYDPAHPFDSMHAERLARAPHVRLEVVPGEGHHIAQVAVGEGQFEPLMRDVLKRALARGATGKHLLHQAARKARAERNTEPVEGNPVDDLDIEFEDDAGA